MKNILLTVVMTGSLMAQTASYPGSVATDSQLKISVNGVNTVLRGNITAEDTIITVASSSKLVPYMLLTIGRKEIVAVTAVSGNNVTVVRGFDGTTAQQFTNGAEVASYPTAYDRNILAAEIKAIESSLGPSLSNISGVAGTSAGMYVWSQTPGGSLTGGGGNVVTLTPCPKGVNGTNAGHYVYVSGGVGAAEAALITGGSCTSGASSGTIIFTPANNHSGSWTVGTATVGVQEALYVLGGPGAVFLAAGDYVLQGPITTPAITTNTQHHYSLFGAGRHATRLTLSTTFPLSASGVIVAGYDGTHGMNGPSIRDIGIICPQPWTSSISAYTHWPPVVYANHTTGLQLSRMYVAGAWTGFSLQNGAGAQTVIDDIQMSAFNRGIDLQNNADAMRIRGFHFWPFTDSATPTYADQAQILAPGVTGLYAANNQGIAISDSFFFSDVALDLAGGDDIVTVNNTSFDGFGSVKVGGAAGGAAVAINNSFWYHNGNTVFGYNCHQPALTVSNAGANLNISNSTFHHMCATYPLVSVTAPAGYNPSFSQITMTGNTITDTTNSASDAGLFVLNGTAGALMNANISNNHIAYAYAQTYVNPMLAVTGTAIGLNFQGNMNEGYGSGTWVSIAQDTPRHTIAGNVLQGPFGAWTMTLPASKLNGFYQDTTAEWGPADPVRKYTTGVYNVTGYNANLICDATSGVVQFNLPFANVAVGATYFVKKIDASANACALVRAASETFDGATSLNITTQYQAVTITSDGTNWWKH